MSDAVSTPAGSAVDYIRDVLGIHEVFEEPRTYARRMVDSSPSLPTEVYRSPASMPAPSLPSMPAVGKPEPALSKPEPGRSQWERISLDPDIELHVRHPLTRQNKKAVARLIAIARQLFEED